MKNSLENIQIAKLTEQHVKNKKKVVKLKEGELILLYTEYDEGEYREKINPRNKKVFKIHKSYIHGLVSYDNCFTLDYSLMCSFRGFDKIRYTVVCTNPNGINCIGCLFIKEKPVIGWIKYFIQKLKKES